MLSGATHVRDQQRPLRRLPLRLRGLPLHPAPRPAQVQHLRALHTEAVRAQQVSGAAFGELETITGDERLREQRGHRAIFVSSGLRQQEGQGAHAFRGTEHGFCHSLAWTSLHGRPRLDPANEPTHRMTETFSLTLSVAPLPPQKSHLQPPTVSIYPSDSAIWGNYC